jgi:hypothetical protein
MSVSRFFGSENEVGVQLEHEEKKHENKRIELQ